MDRTYEKSAQRYARPTDPERTLDAYARPEEELTGDLTYDNGQEKAFTASYRNEALEEDVPRTDLPTGETPRRSGRTRRSDKNNT